MVVAAAVSESASYMQDLKSSTEIWKEGVVFKQVWGVRMKTPLHS